METKLLSFLFQDPRFNAEVDKATGYKTHSILCMPIKSHDGEVPTEKLLFHFLMFSNSLVYICQCLKKGWIIFVSFQVIGVAQIINKKTGKHQFSQKDEEVSTFSCSFVLYLFRLKTRCRATPAQPRIMKE